MPVEGMFQQPTMQMGMAYGPVPMQGGGMETSFAQGQSMERPTEDISQNRGRTREREDSRERHPSDSRSRSRTNSPNQRGYNPRDGGRDNLRFRRDDDQNDGRGGWGQGGLGRGSSVAISNSSSRGNTPSHHQLPSDYRGNGSQGSRRRMEGENTNENESEDLVEVTLELFQEEETNEHNTNSRVGTLTTVSQVETEKCVRNEDGSSGDRRGNYPVEDKLFEAIATSNETINLLTHLIHNTQSKADTMTMSQEAVVSAAAMMSSTKISIKA